MLPSLLAAFCIIGSVLSTEPRLRRQLEFNASVPYIFSARLYPFGADRGDLLVHGDGEPYALEHPITFLGDKYENIYIRRDGSIGFRESGSALVGLPSQDPTVAVFWALTNASRVLYRETDDADIVNLAHNEVNIQYRYGARFRVRSVVIITWEADQGHQGLFQLALIVGDSLTFAHFVYSRLAPGIPGFAGFSSGNISFSLPDSGTSDAFLLGERSDIGIPGEWLFEIDGPQVFLCGAGFRGLECVESCLPSQWSNDCHRNCHCEGGDPCDQENGRCPSATCSPGWTGPACEDDVDECLGEAACPPEQPDCVNTAGAFLCLCFEYDEEKKTCKGAPAPKEVFAVPDISLQPSIGRISSTTTTRASPPPRRMNIKTTTSAKTPETTTTATTPVVHSAPVFKEEQECVGCHSRAECVDKECKCLPGWEGDGFSCHDIDECSSDICGPNALCRNSPGSFDCDCQVGFASIDGKCTDVDECANAPCGLGEGVLCVNEPGSFRCECKDGFDKHNNCKDIDECSIPNACGPNAKCSNTAGAFECECLPGFERLFEGANCTDINECIVEPCHSAARCVNEPGSFDCQCIEGFVGDGLECHETMMYPIANDSVVVPRAPEASAALVLSQPILYFGKRYDTAYLSSNGIISFDGPVKSLLENPPKDAREAVLILHAQIDYAREGLVAYTFVNESDESAYAILTRASVAAETQFGLPDFRPQHLHVITFDRVRQAGSGNLNSFQAVFACSQNVTVLTLIYDKIEAKGAISGVSSNSFFHELPTELLSSQSNVGRPGRWMMRVDSSTMEPCPPGRTRTPLCDQECAAGQWGFGCRSICHCAGRLPCDPITGRCSSGNCEAGWKGSLCDQDIDECADGVVVCDSSSECVNSIGGYECRCRSGFIRNGSRCDPIDACRHRFNRPCSPSASCVEKKNGATCECNEGLRGDGFHCEQRDSLPIVDIAKEILVPSLEGLPSVDEDVITEVGENPFVMQTWIPAQTPSTTKKTPSLVTAPPPETTKTPRNISTSTTEPEGLSSLYLWFGLPVLLCFIWLILVLFMVVMWHKRKNRREDSFDGVWKQPSNNTTATRRGSTAIYGRRY